MTVFVVLRIESDDEARTLVQDIAEYPTHPLLTPIQENTVHASVESSAVSAWESCRRSADGWCLTHSTDAGPVYCGATS